MKSLFWLLFLLLLVALTITGFVTSAIQSFSRHEILLSVCYSITAIALAFQATWRYLLYRKQRGNGKNSRIV